MNNAADFSNNEQEVIDLLLQGKSNKQIAAELKISNRTVEFHLTNIYQKLGLASRAEAIVRLTQSVPGREYDLRESTVDFLAQNNDNQMKFLSGGAVVRKRLVFAAGGLILFAILVYFILFALFKPVPGNMLETDEVGWVVVQTLSAMPAADIPAAETAIPTGQITTVPSALTFEQTDGSATYRLTVNWFYIDSTRAEFEYTVCGLPIPAGLDPVLIVHRSEMVLKDHTGNQISVHDFGDFGAGDGRSTDLSDAQNSCFNQVDSYQILDARSALSQSDEYSISIPVGGEMGSSQGEVFQIPLMDFAFLIRPTYAKNLTFSGNKTFLMGEKEVSLVGFQINPRQVRAQLCISSSDGLQWIPDANLGYKGKIYINHGWSMDSDDALKRMCYSLSYYGNFEISTSDDALQNTDLLLSRLVQDQQETIPDETIQSARLSLADQGIDFEVVTGDHGRRLDIIKMPEGMTMTEAQAKIGQALTTDLQTGDILVFNLK